MGLTVYYIIHMDTSQILNLLGEAKNIELLHGFTFQWKPAEVKLKGGSMPNCTQIEHL